MENFQDRGVWGIRIRSWKNGSGLSWELWSRSGFPEMFDPDPVNIRPDPKRCKVFISQRLPFAHDYLALIHRYTNHSIISISMLKPYIKLILGEKKTCLSEIFANQMPCLYPFYKNYVYNKAGKLTKTSWVALNRKHCLSFLISSFLLLPLPWFLPVSTWNDTWARFFRSFFFWFRIEKYISVASIWIMKQSSCKSHLKREQKIVGSQFHGRFSRAMFGRWLCIFEHKEQFSLKARNDLYR